MTGTAKESSRPNSAVLNTHSVHKIKGIQMIYLHFVTFERLDRWTSFWYFTKTQVGGLSDLMAVLAFEELFGYL